MRRFNPDGALSRNFSTRVGQRNRRLTSPRRRPITPLYTRFEGGDIIENAQADTITAAMWSNNDGELIQASGETYTSSVQMDASGVYYAEIYRENPQTSGNEAVEPQFAMAYGHYHGSGSAPVSQYASEGMTPTKAIYQQYRNLCLAPGDEQFSINDVNATASFFINVNRQRFKERIDPGNWDITLVGGSYGSTFTLTDDSSVNSAKLGDSGAIYAVVSGSVGDTIEEDAIQYGWLYPDLGIIMISPAALGWTVDETNYCWCPGSALGTEPGGAGTGTAIANVPVNPTLTETMIGSLTGSGAQFQARSAEQIYATHYFIRLKNSEYNFSNNPSFTSGSQGVFAHPSMFRDPKVYITTVGMYNDRNELLAIAKLSKPLLKSFTREALIRVKLEF